MKTIDSIAALEALYDPAVQTSLDKVADRLTPLYRRWVEASKFAVLSTVGPEGTDASPRGDDGPVVAVADERTLLMPDWKGNNRLDSLRNIVRDPRVSLMFMVPGSSNVVRINGKAVLTHDAELTEKFLKGTKRPACVIVLTIDEVYFQCAKAILRSGLWSGEDASDGLPTAGDFIKQFRKDFAAKEYDETYAERAKERFW